MSKFLTIASSKSLNSSDDLMIATKSEWSGIILIASIAC